MLRSLPLSRARGATPTRAASRVSVPSSGNSATRVKVSEGLRRGRCAAVPLAPATPDSLEAAWSGRHQSPSTPASAAPALGRYALGPPAGAYLLGDPHPHYLPTACHQGFEFERAAEGNGRGSTSAACAEVRNHLRIDPVRLGQLAQGAGKVADLAWFTTAIGKPEAPKAAAIRRSYPPDASIITRRGRGRQSGYTRLRATPTLLARAPQRRTTPSGTLADYVGGPSVTMPAYFRTVRALGCGGATKLDYGQGARPASSKVGEAGGAYLAALFDQVEELAASVADRPGRRSLGHGLDGGLPGRPRP